MTDSVAIKLIKRLLESFEGILNKDIHVINGVKYVKYTDAKLNLNNIRAMLSKHIKED